MSNNAAVDHDELACLEIDAGETDDDESGDDESEFANMNEEEFESFLTEAICEFAEENSAPSPRIVTFYEAGLLTKNHGLVVRIGEAEFQVRIVRSR
ncbi:MAG TPA: hypothetical protein VF469_19265 [Kofleriaceae bacterium]